MRSADRLAILAANRAEYLISFLGTMRASCCAIRRAPQHCRDVPRNVIGDAFEALLDAGEFTAVEAENDESALFPYTSGSTGRPKPSVGARDARHAGAATGPARSNNGGTIVRLPSFNTATYIDAVSRNVKTANHRCQRPSSLAVRRPSTDRPQPCIRNLPQPHHFAAL